MSTRAAQLALACALSVTSLGCGKAPVPSPLPAASAPAAEASAAARPRPVAMAPSVLGEPCEAARARLDGALVLCGRGRVAATYTRYGSHFEGVERGEGFEVLFEERSDSGVAALRVAAREAVLVVERVTCERCAAIQGWSFAGRLPDVDASALRALACRTAGSAGRDSDLRTVAGWKALLARPPRSPTDRECDTRGPRIGGETTDPTLLDEACTDASQDARDVVCKDGHLLPPRAGAYLRVRSIDRGDGFDLVYSGALQGAAGRFRGNASLDVSMRGDMLVAHHMECSSCAARQGWTFVGAVRKMSASERKHLACRMTGRPGTSQDLETERGWVELLAQGTPDAGAAAAECADVPAR